MKHKVVIAIALTLSTGLALQTDHILSKDLQVLEGESDAIAPPSFAVAKDPKLPTTSRCVIIIVVQYMITYIALAVCRTYQEFSGIAKGPVEGGLRAAAQTLSYGPMICVLFIACQMRVEFLSEGRDEPQVWVQCCMYAMTFAVLVTALLVLSLPLIVGEPLPLREGSCDLERPAVTAEDSKVTFYAVSAVRYMILFGLYGGIAGVIVGIHTYLPPGATDLSKLPSPAPAIMCTMILAVVFFLTQLVIAVCRTYTEFMGVAFPKTIGIMTAAASSVEFSPMLCIVFLAARMRALQHDSQPEVWAQQCMYAATASMCATTLLAILVPLSLSDTSKTQSGETTFQAPNRTLGYILITVRFLCMFGFYGGVLGVIYSIFTFVAQAGPEATLPVSPTVLCVTSLTCQFFFVYLVMIVCQTVSEVSSGKFPLEEHPLYIAVDGSKATLGFAPMLSILFVTTHMHALLITGNKGAPQAWVQDGMYMATWSLFISFVSCFLTGLVLDKVETDEDGNVMNKFSDNYTAIAMTILRYVTMLLLYGGVVMVIVGMLVMTPETANGRGSVTLVSDASNATLAGHATLTGITQAVRNARWLA